MKPDANPTNPSTVAKSQMRHPSMQFQDYSSKEQGKYLLSRTPTDKIMKSRIHPNFLVAFLAINLCAPHAKAEVESMSKEESKESTTSSVPSTTSATPTLVESSASTPPENTTDVTTKPADSSNTTNSALEKSDTTSKIQRNKLFMWKATKGNQTIFLLGTIHIARPEFYPLPSPIESALTQADSLVVELAIDRIDKSQMLKSLQNVAAYTAGDSLEKHLTPKTKEALAAYLKWSGESLAMYNDYKPWMVQMLLESAAMRREGFASDLGIDRHLLSAAKKRNKKVLELETTESQFKALSSATDAEQDKLLFLSLSELKQLSERIQQFEKAWRTGDDAAMLKATQIDAGTEDLRKFHDEIILKRNILMTEKLEQLAKGQSIVLCAVGSAHLVGDKGIPNLVKAKGYNVEQVTTDLAVAAMPSLSGRAKKMQNLFYPEGLFSVSLPGNPNMKYANVAGLRSVDYTYPEFSGLYQVSYLVLPNEINAAVQNKMYDAIAADLVKKSRGTLIRNYATTQQGRPARQVDIKTMVAQKVGAKPQPVIMRLKMVSAGKRFYLIGGTGTAAWLSSPAVTDFMNSLSIRSETSTARQAPSRSSSPFAVRPSSSSFASRSQTLTKSSSDFRRDFDAHRKEMDRQFSDSRSNARKNFEGARARHERMWGR